MEDPGRLQRGDGQGGELTWCLICGQDFCKALAEVEVKQEVLEETEAQGTLEGNRVTTIGRRSEEDKWIFHCLLKWFGGGMNKEVTIELGWKESEEDEPIPVCGECKEEIGPVMELQRQLEGIQRRIDNGVEGIREKMEAAEGLFGRKGIYKRDSRYKNLRRRVVKGFSKMGNSPLKKRARGSLTGEGKQPRRKSLRKRGDQVVEEINEEILTSQDPLTMLPTEDTTVNHLEEDFQDLLDVKPEMDHLFSSELIDEAIRLADEDKTDKDKESTSKRRSTRARNVKRSKDSNEASFVQRDPVGGSSDDDEPNIDHYHGGGDSDYNPDSSSPPRSRKRTSRAKGRTTKRKDDDIPSKSPRTPRTSRNKKRKLSKEEEDDNDDEWTSGETHHDHASDSSSSDSILIPEEKDKKGSGKIIEDPTSRTLTYRNLKFLPVSSPDPQSTSKHYQCSQCNSIIEFSSYRIPAHYYRHHSDRYLCPQCNSRQDSRTNLKLHIRRVHQNGPPRRHKPFPCPICAKPVTAASKTRHLWTHKSQEERQEALNSSDPSIIPSELRKRHICEICGYSAKTPGILRKHHQAQHSLPEEREGKKELCPQCGGYYLHLKTHLDRVHASPFSGKTFTCFETGCGKTFKNLRDLARHKQVHSTEKRWKCSQCPREFGSKPSWKRHEQLHLGIRPWPCTICGMAFGSKSNLHRHEGIYHNPEGGGKQPKRKPYVRGVTMLAVGKTKRELVQQGKYLPPSALQTWAAGREPTSHFLPVTREKTEDEKVQD